MTTNIESAVQVFLYLLYLYLSIGLIFLIPFHWKWMKTFDSATKEAPILFKILIAPACIALWPLLLRKIIKSRQDEPDPKKNAPD